MQNTDVRKHFRNLLTFFGVFAILIFMERTFQHHPEAYLRTYKGLSLPLFIFLLLEGALFTEFLFWKVHYSAAHNTNNDYP